MDKGMIIIGLTGGVAAGKTLAAEAFRAEGIPVIDLDFLGRELLESPPRELKIALDTHFGTRDRIALRHIVFGDEKKRKELEALLHPLIWKEFETLAKSHAKAGKKLILCEAALLVESGSFKKFPQLVVVTAPDGVRKLRLKKRDKADDAVIEGIFRAQLPQSEKAKHATHTIANDTTPEALKEKVHAIVNEWRKGGLL